jgi:hypothetical protein
MQQETVSGCITALRKNALRDTQQDEHSENLCQLQHQTNSQNIKNIEIKSESAARPAPKNNKRSKTAW